MKTHIPLLIVTSLLINSELIAGTPTLEYLSKEIDRVNYVETAQSGIALGGYVDTGYLYNFSGQALAGRTGTDGNANGDFNLNQANLYLEKSLADEIDRFQAGFRVDLMYGEDAAAFGQNGPASSNSFYVQQAYISLGVPVGNGLRMEVGKWAALVGFESENRVENVNITYGYSGAVDPAWHTGIVAYYPVTELLEVGFGVSNGNGIDSSNGVVAGVNDSTDAVGLTGFALLSNEAGNAELQGSFYYAPDGDVGYGTDNEPLLVLNLWGVWVPEIT